MVRYGMVWYGMAPIMANMYGMVWHQKWATGMLWNGTNNGPQVWGDMFPVAGGGVRQSPIDIVR